MQPVAPGKVVWRDGARGHGLFSAPRSGSGRCARGAAESLAARPRRCILNAGMKRVLTALILAPLVLALVFLGPMWLITLVVAVVAMLAAWEFLALTEHRGAKPPKVADSGGYRAAFCGQLMSGQMGRTATLFGVLCVVLLVYCTFRSPVDRALADATSSVFALFYLGLTLIPLPMLREAHATARRCWRFCSSRYGRAILWRCMPGGCSESERWRRISAPTRPGPERSDR